MIVDKMIAILLLPCPPYWFEGGDAQRECNETKQEMNNWCSPHFLYATLQVNFITFNRINIKIKGFETLISLIFRCIRWKAKKDSSNESWMVVLQCGRITAVNNELHKCLACWWLHRQKFRQMFDTLSNTQNQYHRISPPCLVCSMPWTFLIHVCVKKSHENPLRRADQSHQCNSIHVETSPITHMTSTGMPTFTFPWLLPVLNVPSTATNTYKHRHTNYRLGIKEGAVHVWKTW